MVKLNESEFVEAFERLWNPAKSGCDAVVAFLQKHFSVPFDPNLVCELIQIDLERAWMHWDKQISQASVSDNYSDILARLGTLPRLTEYRCLLEAVKVNDAQVQQLVQSEYELRNQCGDMIGAAYYQSYFGIEVSDDWGPTLRHVYGSSIDDGNQELVKGIPLRGLNLFGRRRSSDCRTLAFQSNPEGSRVIVAPMEDRRVSRIQASVQILNTASAWVSNDGSVNAMVLSTSQLLNPGEGRVLCFPFRIRLPNITLEFR